MVFFVKKNDHGFCGYTRIFCKDALRASKLINGKLKVIFVKKRPLICV